MPVDILRTTVWGWKTMTAVFDPSFKVTCLVGLLGIALSLLYIDPFAPEFDVGWAPSQLP
jgi:hypothetical protein